MSVNTTITEERDPLVAVAFRLRESDRRILEIVGAREGHSDLSSTLRAAVQAYLSNSVVQEQVA